MSASRNTVLKGLGTHHVSLQTLDLEVSLSFYRDVLGLIPVAQFGTPERTVHLLDIGDGSHLELASPIAGSKPVAQVAPYRHVALRVDDLVAAIEVVRAAGRPITVEPKHTVLDGRKTIVAFFEGPGGESVELFQEGEGWDRP